MGVSELLRRSPLFGGFDDEKLERLAAPFSEVEFRPDQVLIESRTPGAGLFVICDGTVVVEAGGLERELGPGEVVGEISLVEDDGLRRARVVAKGPVSCLALSRPEFDRMLETEPELAEAMRELARERLAEIEASGRAEPGRPTP
jgi:CRP-like cAMP-binding protein